MSMRAIDRTIRVLCLEINSQNREALDWRLLTEEQLLYEAAVCMFSSQMVFEVAEAAARRLWQRDLFMARWQSRADYEEHLVAALSEPLAVERDGEVRQVFPRFKNRWASMLATTVTSMENRSQSLRKILRSSDSAQTAREMLVSHVWGFGPKQASLFLRRVGYCSELAVLDTHILDYLRLAKGIDPKPGDLSRLNRYERIETEFQQVAAEFGHPVGCVDLAMWVTMRVAKREAIW